MLRRALKIFGLALLAALGGMLALGWQAFGRTAEGERLERMRHSPQWLGNSFENPQPLRNDFAGSISAMFKSGRFTAPVGAIPVERTNGSQYRAAPTSGLRVTWFGHSSTLVEIDGARVLTDPVFSERVSPYPWLGPKRWYPPPVTFGDLPAIDVVVISHDHYDHLDMYTVKLLLAGKAIFVVPLGIGAHLAYWGIPTERIVELDWWQETQVGRLRVVLTPARHASGRWLVDFNKKLWGGFALIGKKKRVYYSGDTGLFPAMKEIGRRLGPFDLTMIEVGQYNRSWPDWHIGPEQAVKAHRWVNGRTMLPVHWGLFVLAAHNWTEPIERVLREAEPHGVRVATPKPGEAFEPAQAAADLRFVKRWWPAVEWQSAAEHPIISTQVE